MKNSNLKEYFNFHNLIKYLLIVVISGFLFNFLFYSDPNPEPLEDPNITHYIDPTNKKDLKFVLSEHENLFQPISIHRLNFGFSDANIWLKINLKKIDSNDLILHLNNSNLNEIHFYTYNPKTSEVVELLRGRFLDSKITDNSIKNFYFYIENNSEKEYYLKINSSTQLNIPIKIWDQNQFLKKKSRQDLLKGGYFSTQFFIIIAGFFLIFIIKDKYLLLFSVYPLVSGYSLIEQNGIFPSLQFSKIFITNHLDHLPLPLLNFFAIRYTMKFLNYHLHSPSIQLILDKLNYGNLALYLLYFFLDYKHCFYLSNFLIILNSIVLILLAYLAWNNYIASAIPIGLTFLISMVSSVINLFYPLLHFTNFDPINLQLFLNGSQSYLLIIGLVLRLNIAMKDKMRAEKSISDFERIQLDEKDRLLKKEIESFEYLKKITFQKEKFINFTYDLFKEPIQRILSIIHITNTNNQLNNNLIDDSLILIHTNTLNIKNTINELVEFINLESETYEVKIEKWSLFSIVDFNINLLRLLNTKKNILILNNLLSKHDSILIDEEKLNSILSKLFFIIFNFIDTNTTLEIKNETDEEYNTLILEFLSDQFHKQKIEDFFFPIDDLMYNNIRIDSHSNLYIQKKIMEKMNGDLSIQNAKNKILFKIKLPIFKNNIDSINLKINWVEFHLQNTTHTNKEIQLDNPTTQYILLISNDNEQVETSEYFLKKQKNNISSCNDLKIAEQLIDQKKPMLIIIDLFITGESSIDFIQKIRKTYSEIELPILLIISKNNTEDVFNLVDLGITDYITKPFTMERFYSRIKVALNISKLVNSYERFVPKNFVKLLSKNSITDINLGDQLSKHMTVLFSDLRSFTELSESMTPEENFKFLNSYFARIGPIIRNNSGFIDKYIGDAIMALFPNNADDALKTAIQIQREIIKYNYENRYPNRIFIQAGIGIHTGEVILGTIGEEQRMEGTVVSDAVNLTSRLENLTKLYGASILISMDTFLELDDYEIYHYRILDKVRVKGKKKFITVVEIFDGLPEDTIHQISESKVFFEEGVASYNNREFDSAIKLFQKSLSIYEKDKPSKIYIQRCEYYKQHNVPLDWDGVEILEDK
jgi:class 3 adenylate cyclase/CheY-like chemotaxis protein